MQLDLYLSHLFSSPTCISPTLIHDPCKKMDFMYICPTLIWFGNDAYEIELGLVELRAMDGTHDKRRKVKLAATDHVSDMRTFCPIG